MPPTRLFAPADVPEMVAVSALTLATVPDNCTLLIHEKLLRPNAPPTQLELDRTVPLI